MEFIADFHIHSHFSIATSKNLNPENLHYWAGLKGIKVVGTGDFTHPGWLKELQEKLEPAEEGLYRLKEQYQLRSAHSAGNDIRFILTTEISSIYKKYDRVRKVHNLIFAPDFETVEKIQQKLAKIGNIEADGRPILGLDSRDLLDLALSCSERVFFVPAHIWTPWFSALGAKSGFDSIEECYGDLSSYIYAVETGLSSDPPMNRMCSFLDRYTLISNSDAHSAEKLGREANLFDTGLSYPAIIESLKQPRSKGFKGTVEFFPQEGKYHFDGHRKCKVVLNPLETLRLNGTCPVCGKPLTIGVLNRVAQLADREKITFSGENPAYYSLIPLKEILAEIYEKGPNSLAVKQAYMQLLKKAGSEFNVLLHLPVDAIQKIANDAITEAIRRMRQGEVFIREGYDGEYGVIKIFKDDEEISRVSQSTLFIPAVSEKNGNYIHNRQQGFDWLAYRRFLESQNVPKEEKAVAEISLLNDLDPDQQVAVRHSQGPALILAGPGTGKTRVLTSRIAYLISECRADPLSILAVTFTNKAAQEMRERLVTLLGDKAGKVWISTFHALGHHILNLYRQNSNDKTPWHLIDEPDKKFILQHELGCEAGNLKQIITTITNTKQGAAEIADIPDPAHRQLVSEYQSYLREHALLDLDDLIYLPVLLLRENRSFLDDLHREYQWFLVDEYQDVNAAQYNLIRLLTDKKYPSLFVIGDANQAIYGFRGADVGFIRQFREDFPEAEEYHLHQSFRCSDLIIQASDNVLNLPLWSEGSLRGLKQGVKTTIASQASDKSEAEYVARTIEQMIGGLRFFSMDSAVSSGEQNADIKSLSDFAILCRLRHQFGLIEKALQDHSIPYQSISDDKFADKPVVRQLIDLLKLSINPESRYLQNKIIMQYKIGKSRLRDMVQGVQRESSVTAKIRMLRNFRTEFKQKENDAIFEILMEMASESGDDASAFLDKLVLGHEIDRYRSHAEKVTLLTLHAAKGLEFECVFIVGCEDGLIPFTILEDRQSDFEEENRLLYVGMTRAKKYLFLTHARRRMLMGRSLQLVRSPYLDRIEQELISYDQPVIKKHLSKDDGQLRLF